MDEVDRRLDTLERKMDTASVSLERHLASCERLGQAALDARVRMEDSLRQLAIKLDMLMSRQSEQTGAMKFSKFLWSALVAIATFIGWGVAHLGVIR